mgnify:CR=1 FL=1|tara:strand:+ start:6050 stop:6673 length:624 start_codon:yes stop_codon:yes gene_type:complete
MSRFDRRLGTGPYAKTNTTTSSRRYSPRPGTADCKLPSRNDVIMNSPMLNNTFVTNNSNENNRTSMLINSVSEKNAKIMEKLKTTRNQSEKILLNHELRLNTVELNIDCLNNLKMEADQKIMNESLENYKKKINTLEKTLKEMGDKMILLTQMIQENEINKNIEKKQKMNKVSLDINDIEEEVVKKVNNTSVENKETVVNDDGPHFE